MLLTTGERWCTNDGRKRVTGGALVTVSLTGE